MKLNEEFKNHLTDKLLPFWKSLKDDENGGFYGFMDSALVVDLEAEKGCILNSRILWFFSNAYMTLKDESLKEYADHAYAFLKEKCLDKENGGIYWSMDYKGNPLDTTKHTYNQAFAIYALASYYDAFGNEEALKTADRLFNVIETKCKDQYGYKEAQSQEFKEVPNDKLSENGVMADRTMNTLLHVFEAYTELLRVSKKHGRNVEVSIDVADNLRKIMDTIAHKVYNPELKRQEVFFDNDMKSILDLHSYGHDIETAWLIDRGLDVLDDEEYRALLNPIVAELETNILNTAYSNHSLANECEKGVVNEWRIWWVQAEAVVGFYNAFQKRSKTGHGSAEAFRAAALDIWEFIKTKLTDSREGSEWYWRLTKDGTPDMEKPIVEPWKCPYHNGRLCMEMIRRTEGE